MSKRKRFTKQFEIEAEILKHKHKLKKHLAEAERLEALSDKEFKKSFTTTYSEGERTFFADNGREFHVKAKKLRRSAFLIEQNMLPRLKQTFATFKTNTMPFMEDGSVEMED
jgi:uncharacterized membrane protein YgaE (UPF0421/DUF939 family)